jgi:hypothetical protein
MHHEVECLVGQYDQGTLSRRQLLQGLVALCASPYVARPVAGGLLGTGQTSAPFHTRTLNHVTLYASSVARSKAFYQRLTGCLSRRRTRISANFGLKVAS